MRNLKKRTQNPEDWTSPVRPPVARSKILLLNSLLLKAIFLGFGPKAEKCPKRAHGETAMLTVCEWRWTRRAPTGTAKKGARIIGGGIEWV